MYGKSHDEMMGLSLFLFIDVFMPSFINDAISATINYDHLSSLSCVLTSHRHEYADVKPVYPVFLSVN